jgi:hypothetical protein
MSHRPTALSCNRLVLIHSPLELEALLGLVIVSYSFFWKLVGSHLTHK